VLDNNIHGTKVLYDAAVDAGVEKFVFASSNHAVGHFETERKPDLYRTDDDFRLDGTELPRPGNHYGVSKATGELIGRYYHDEYGIDVCNVRIGNLTRGHPPVDYERGQAMWLSYRDCAHIHARALGGRLRLRDRLRHLRQRPEVLLPGAREGGSGLRAEGQFGGVGRRGAARKK